MSFLAELDNLTFDQLINRFEIPKHHEGAVYYQEVAARIRAQGDIGIGFLFGKLNAARMEQTRGILVGLTCPPLEASTLRTLLRQKLLAYLDDKRPLVVMDAIDALRVQNERDILDKILALRNHPSPYVRSAVLRYSHFHPAEAHPLLLAALQDPHYLVRENAIDELDDLGVVDAVQHIHPLLEDAHPHVRQAAQTAIDNLMRLAIKETDSNGP